MSLWTHQAQGLSELWQLIDSGCRRPCLVSPTGGGKSRMICEAILEAERRNWSSVLYSPRVWLTEQLSADLDAAGISYGVRASQAERSQIALLKRCQISSPLTEESKVYKSESRELHKADLVIFDERHIQRGEVAEKITRDHLAQGAKAVVGVTATPVKLGHLHDALVIAGTKAELRACGALIACDTYAPDEPDLSKIRKTSAGEYSEASLRKVIKVQQVFGRVLDQFRKLNPCQKPSLCFAPGVAESRWLVELFTAAGVTAAHVDGLNCVVDGREYKSDKAARDEILERSKAGDIKVICNRFVLREGINAPWLAHGIFLTCFGAMSSYLQAGGRLLRAYPGLDLVTIQDHGGNYWRHMSLNRDYDWQLGDDDKTIAKKLKAKREAGDEIPPIECPVCHFVRSRGPKCPRCGHEHKQGVRFIAQTDGELKRTRELAYKRKQKREVNSHESIWLACYFSAVNGGRQTLEQALSNYKRKCNAAGLEYKAPYEYRYALEQGDGRWQDTAARVHYSRLAQAKKARAEQGKVKDRGLIL